MWRFNDAIVISDLHLSSDEPERALSGDDAALEQFLLWVVGEIKGCAVVLNGDIVDFLFAESKPGLDVEKLEKETDAIISRHKAVFKALGQVACSPDHSLFILSGNHDPELIFPEVRQRFEAALSVDDQRPHVSWLTYGEALRLNIGPVKILIEHGDRLDSWNEIDRDLLNSAASLTSRGLSKYHEYVPPLGSRLVSNHLLNLRQQFPWIELLKPEREAMLPLLRYLTSFSEKAGASGALNLCIQAEAKSRLTRLRQRVDPAFRFRKDEDDGYSIGAKIKRMAQEIYESRGELKRTELIGQLQQAAKNDTFFKLDVPDGDYIGDLEFLLQNGADLLIHGHTHSAKAYPVREGLYLNSGTWARLLSLPAANSARPVWDKFLKSIENRSYEVQQRPTYVRVTREGSNNSTAASVHLWSQEKPLALWRFSEQRQWLNQMKGDVL